MVKNSKPSCYRIRVLVFMLFLCFYGFCFAGKISSIQGTVRDEKDDRILVAASVSIPVLNLQTFSDMHGSYSLGSIPPGQWQLVVSATGYETQSSNPIRVYAGQEVEQNLWLARDKRFFWHSSASRLPVIVGMAIDSVNGTPVDSVLVAVEPDHQQFMTGSDGVFCFTGLSEQPHILVMTNRHYETDTLKTASLRTEAVYTLNAVLQPLRYAARNTGKVSGTVYDSSAIIPLVDAAISVVNTSYTGRSDSIGLYEITGIPAGAYTLIISKNGYELAIFPTIEIAGGKTVQRNAGLVKKLQTGITADILSGGVTCIVHNESGKPLDSALVCIDYRTSCRFTDSLGQCSIDSIPSGLYTITVHHPAYDSQKTADVEVLYGKQTHLVMDMKKKGSDEASAFGTASISGMVIDKESAAGLPGSRILIRNKKNSYTAISTSQGSFFITAIEPGTYAVSAALSGYTEQIITNVALVKGEVRKTDFLMIKSGVTEFGRMTVRTVALQNTEAAVLKERQAAFTVTDGISAAEISKSGAGNANDAMKRVIGVTTSEGRYVNIRGLGERFVNTTLNGSSIPSPDPDKRIVPFDLFPSNLIDKIVIFKTFSPDQIGTFAGGSVDIQTKTLPDSFVTSLSVSTGVNPAVLGADKILSYKGGKTDWLGIDDGTRKLPDFVANLPADSLPAFSSMLKKNSGKSQLLDRYSRSFNNYFYQRRTSGYPNIGVSYALGNRFSLFERPLGCLLSVTYSNSLQHYENGIKNDFEYGGNADSTSGLRPMKLFSDTKTTKTVLFGGVSQAHYSYRKDHSIGLTELYVRNGEDQTEFISGKYYPNIVARVFENRMQLFTERELNSLQIVSKNRFNLPFAIDLVSKGTLTNTMQNQPDQRVFKCDRVNTESKNADSLDYQINSSLYNYPIRFFRTLKESGPTANVDATIYLTDSARPDFSLKAGFCMSQRLRELKTKFYVLNQDEKIFTKFGGDFEKFMDMQNVGIIGFDTTNPAVKKSIFGLYYQEYGVPSSNYSAESFNAAWYAMFNWRFFDRIIAMLGVRHEQSVMMLENQKDSIQYAKNFSSFLPAFSIITELNPRMNIRAVYGRTLALPTIREVAPFASEDVAKMVMEIGNRYLDKCTIDNYDLRWELFQQMNDLVALSAFYKRILNPIEYVIVEKDGQYTYQNVNKCDLLGSEIEARFSLERAVPALSGFRLGCNMAYVVSRINRSWTELTNIQKFDKDVEPTRPLNQQSPYVVNIECTYDNKKVGNSIGLFYNVIGPRINSVSLSRAPDVYEQPFHSVDLLVSKKIAFGISTSMKVTNLLAASVREASVFREKTYINKEYLKNRIYSFSLSYGIKK
ncbi:MAG: TonB-dependent receptor [Chitinivibrionales bacterium]|nr:TonB-dependent receptor [Chitinivibrionales bacterium]